MLRDSHEALYERSMTAVFASLNKVLAKRRWGVLGRAEDGEAQPKAGCRYARQSGSVMRRGRVIEIIRPVSLILYESLHDPPCHVRLQLRWQLHPVAEGSLLRLTLRYELNGAAALRKSHWRRRLRAHCRRLLTQIGTELIRDGTECPASAELRGTQN